MAVICVDASFVLKLLIDEPNAAYALDMWQRWTDDRATIVGPPLLLAEVTSVLRNSVYRGTISAESGRQAFDLFCGLGIVIRDVPDLHHRAWAAAIRFNRPRTYDAFYIALAELEGCDLWTADRRMVNSFRLPNVRLLDEAPTAG